MAVKIEKGGWVLIFAIGLGLVGYSLNRYGVIDLGGMPVVWLVFRVETVAPVAFFASFTVPKIGTPSKSSPAFLGFTPAT